MVKRLVSRRETEKKRKRNQVIVGILLVFLMVAGTLGFAVQGGLGKSDPNLGNTIVYNGFEFVNNNGFWVLGSFVFRNTPEQVENIGSGLKRAEEYQGLPLYYSSENELAEMEIYLNMGQIAQRVQKACLEGEECSDKSLPVKTCADNFIIIKESNIKSIRQEENCVYIEGPEYELYSLADQFLFKILGIR